MKAKIYPALLLLATYTSYSQTPENALPLSWYQPGGTARYQAIGGAMVSLGGDASANHINPAGLGFFKTSDFILSPGYQFDKVKSDYRGTNIKGDKKNAFNLGTSGFIFGGLGAQGKSTFGITVTQLANFNQKIYYSGQNDYSSFATPLADEFAASRLSIEDALNSSSVSLPTRMALYTYIVDTATINGNQQVIARSENPSLLSQQNSIETKGGNTELTLGFGSEVSKKLMLGLSLGIDFIKYTKHTYYHESDATGNTNNEFNFLTYDENYSIKGIGGVFKFGAIYRPAEYVRLGLAIHTPTWMSLKEDFYSGMSADLESPLGYDSVESSVFTGDQKTKSEYQLNTPTKIMISGSYVFREEENIERQKGFITADIEYANYKWIKYTHYDQNDGKDYSLYNQAIDALYKGAFNFRVGGELKFKTVMGRLGFAYYGNPYKESELKGRKMILSGGLGYRNKGMFFDLTYFHHLNKNVNFPYRVAEPKANTFATLAENGGNLMLTIGFKI